MTRRMIRSTYTGGLSRRQILRTGTLLIATGLFPSPGWSNHTKRSLDLYNALTGETIEVAYWVADEYVPEALKALNHFLRDPHNGKVTEIDPGLFDFIYDITSKLGVKIRSTLYPATVPRLPTTSCGAVTRRPPRAVSTSRARR